MLESAELGEIARLKRLTPANAERDYLQELLLFGLYSEVGPELVFKGGTCLYKLHKLGRFSEDLDFTLGKRIDLEDAVGGAIDRLRFLDVSGRVKRVKKHAREVNFGLLLRGPLYRGGRENLCFIPLNVSLRERVALPPERATISSMYREIPSFDVFSMRAEEMLAEKTRAIFAREKPRDLYDMWFLLKKGTQLDLNLVNRKLKIHGMRFDAKKFVDRVERMVKLWDADLKNLVIGELPEFEAVKNSVTGSIEQL
ncbi:MAG: nucleotidyl transferase AbiEii/AbiGii toxin family protein [Hadesarchaea archaeon]|nr:nucleotidyl transferase AbiEii/AbiGii toxin family protein [Hadesarchaea archaeon]